MEVDKTDIDQDQEEEYVLLDLNGVCDQVDIPSDELYILSGLDTLNPILHIGDKLKLIGEYEETIGTCLIFSESEKVPSGDEDSESSEANLLEGVCITDQNQGPPNQITPVTSLQKILKFRLLSKGDEQDVIGEPLDSPSLSRDPDVTALSLRGQYQALDSPSHEEKM